MSFCIVSVIVDSSLTCLPPASSAVPMVALKSTWLTVLAFTASFAAAECEYGKEKAGFVLHLYNTEDCDTKAKGVHHETYSGSRLNFWKNISKSPCICLNLPPPLAGDVKSFTFTSGELWPASLMLFSQKHCRGEELGFSESSWKDKIVDRENRGIHSAWVCVIDVAEAIAALALDE
ncbi:hypothetical protein BV22DRAFT_226616 [Leucogyrophana mollusca]|uniref:Uncharacterized protein n=1 Tax=Leucogyrophana mollusca TaxID=85980 RepID=A0ACB8BR86_9AGAM|nr:hypothetical protein BV22DRAFT_226616 [Leucogyrophana mollusca]